MRFDVSSICLDWLLTQESNYQGAMARHETVISLFILYTFFSTILPVISSQSYKLNTLQQRGVFYCLYSTCSLVFFFQIRFPDRIFCPLWGPPLCESMRICPKSDRGPATDQNKFPTVCCMPNYSWHFSIIISQILSAAERLEVWNYELF